MSVLTVKQWERVVSNPFFNALGPATTHLNSRHLQGWTDSIMVTQEDFHTGDAEIPASVPTTSQS